MWPFSKIRADREAAILSQFKTSSHEMTALEIFRATHIPFSLLYPALYRMEEDGRLVTRVAGRIDGPEQWQKRLYRAPGP